MPTLAQMYNIISTKTDFQRSDAEIYNAINAAGFAVFTDILKESAGFFIKFDETSMVLTPPAPWTATTGLPQNSIIVRDTTGVSWAYSVSNSGVLTSAVSAGYSHVIVLRDTLTGEFYFVQADKITGYLVLQPVAPTPSFVSLVTLIAPNGSLWNMSVIGGFIQMQPTTTVPTNPGMIQEYTLPVDCSQIVHMGERPQSSPTVRWQTMNPELLDQALGDLGNNPFGSYPVWSVYGAHDSQFSYYGPYLTAAETQSGQTNDVQVHKIRVSPQIDQNRSVQLVYTAKWVPVIDSESAIMLPEEATHAILNWALADILQASNDSRASGAYQVAERQNTKMLTWARARQVQSPIPTEPYLL